ncbi:hypothetical protein PNA2_1811 [Pyrococcus sp. NA2]|uniref:DUF2079 domain-containing protein n=1 Tax=Pyrococcus sp. (strain NA2) TaxID=342949 RepID=UPI000209AC08|nr:DUF2079 domain-containing protein [Pyrococcus sp. NA2]AEC52726.1 hypothetical protein PNA2_1811 [Pyrococcus sp. NA2]
MVRFQLKTKLSFHDIIIVIMALVYTIIMIYLSFIKFTYFRYSSFDLGIFTQSLASFIHGRFFFNTLEWQFHSAPNHFAVHFQPILFLLVPIFKFFPSPKTLLVIQSLALGSSILLAYILAKKILNRNLALILTVLYAFNSSLIGINLFEFHPVSLAVPLFILAAIFLVENRELPFILTSFLLLSVKEDTFLGVASLSTWWAFREGFSLESIKKNRRFIILSALAFLYGVIVIKLIIPHFGRGYIYIDLYERINITGRKLIYFLLFNLSFGLLPLFLPRNWILLALPWLENLLASRESQYTFGLHYPYMLVPLSFVGSVFTVKEKEIDLKKVLSILIALGLMTSFATMPIVRKEPEKQFPLIYYSILEPIQSYETAWEVIKALLRTNLSIYTQPEFYPALAVKQNVYVYPSKITPDIVFLNMKTYRGRIFLRRLQRMVNARYRLVYSKNGIRVYAREGLNVSREFSQLTHSSSHSEG